MARVELLLLLCRNNAGTMCSYLQLYKQLSPMNSEGSFLVAVFSIAYGILYVHNKLASVYSYT